MPSFNQQNTAWKEGNYPLFLGQAPALHDSINTNHPKIFEIYKLQKSIDWNETEVDLSQSRMDLLSCPRSIYDIMIKNLAFQWELDSIASRSIAPLFAPFVTNSELWGAWLKMSEIECLTPDHEVLTPTGWLPIAEVTTDTLVAQYDVNGDISFVHPTHVVRRMHTGVMYQYRNQQGHFVQKVTPNHRMLKIDKRNGKAIVGAAQDFHFNIGTTPDACYAPVAGNIIGGGVEHLTALQRFYIAAQADGGVSSRYTGEMCGSIPVWFSFSKGRKIQRLLEICKSADLTIIELTGDAGHGNVKAKRKFKVSVPLEQATDFKSFGWVDLGVVTSGWCEEFIAELKEWDGTLNKGNVRYDTTCEGNADIAQAIGVLAGYRSHKGTRVDSRSSTYSNVYPIGFYPSGVVSGQVIKRTEFEYNGEVHCISVPSTFFIVRCEGGVSVSGNCLHALTYSEIVRQCVPDPQDVFKEVMHNQKMFDRASPVTKAFDNLAKLGAQYTLGMIDQNSHALKVGIIKGVVALYALERIQFMASFAATFAVADQNWFVGAAQLVQKIAQDELFCHAALDREIIRILRADPVWGAIIKQILPELKAIVDAVVDAENQFAAYLFSEGRSMVGLNTHLLGRWVAYNAFEVYDELGIPCKREDATPLAYMDNWLDLNKFQPALQEQDNVNYRLNVVRKDFTDTEIFEFED